MISIGTILIFTSLAITAIFFSFQTHKYNLLLINKIKELQASLAARKNDTKYVEFTVNQAWFMKQVLSESREGFTETLREFFSGAFGATMLWVLVWLSSGLGLFIGVGLAFLNQDTAVKLAAIPIIIIITYISIVFLSEIFTTFKYVRYMRSTKNEMLVAKDLVVMIRAVYILMTREKQFLIIAALLFIYGVFGETIDDLIVKAIAVPNILFLILFGDLASIIGENPALERLLTILVIFAAFTAIIIAIAFVNLYIKFCKILMRIKIPEDFQPTNVLEFHIEEKIRPTIFFWTKISQDKRKH